MQSLACGFPSTAGVRRIAFSYQAEARAGAVRPLAEHGSDFVVVRCRVHLGRLDETFTRSPSLAARFRVHAIGFSDKTASCAMFHSLENFLLP